MLYFCSFKAIRNTVSILGQFFHWCELKYNVLKTFKVRIEKRGIIDKPFESIYTVDGETKHFKIYLKI